MNNTDATKEEPKMLGDLISSTKLLILVDLLMETLSNTSTLVPLKKMSDVQKITIALHAVSHIEELIEIAKDNEYPLGCLMSGITESSTLADLYSGCTLWVTTHTVELEQGKVEVTLPCMKYIPDGSKDGVIPVRVSGPTETTLVLWIQVENAGHGCRWLVLYICLHGIVHTCKVASSDYSGDDLLGDNSDKAVKVTISDKDIVAVSTGYLDQYDPVDLTKYEDCFTPAYVHALAMCVTVGEIRNAEELTLKTGYHDCWKYSVADINKAAQILPAVKKFFINLEDLPDNMGVDQWRAAADRAARMESMYMEGDSRDGTVGAGCEEEVGRLVTRARKVVLVNIKLPDLNSFVKGVIQGLGEEGANCEEIEFQGGDSQVDKDNLQDIGEQLGWKTGNEGPLSLHK